MTVFAARYDLRCPSISTTTREDVYAAAVAQATYCDAAGFDTLALSEHHGVDDGYLPAPSAGRDRVRHRHLPDTDHGGRAAGPVVRPHPAGRGHRRARSPEPRAGGVRVRPRLPAGGVCLARPGLVPPRSPDGGDSADGSHRLAWRAVRLPGQDRTRYPHPVQQASPDGLLRRVARRRRPAGSQARPRLLPPGSRHRPRGPLRRGVPGGGP